MKKAFLTILMFLAIINAASAQIPLEIINNTTNTDSNVYACIIGLNSSNKRVYVNLKTGAQVTTSSATNTMSKTGGTDLYGNIFTKLSDLAVNANTGRKTVTLSEISSVRVYFSIGNQLYIKFYDDGGYTGPVYGGVTDPNYGTTFEMIELNYASNVMYINTSRVDSFNYPIGIELFAANNVYQKSGELKTLAAIGTAFLSAVPTEFKGCYDASNGRIQFPTNTTAFKTGGAYVDYSKTYIDAIWTKYKTEDLYFNGGGIGIWKGRVDSSGKLTLTGQANLDGTTGPYQGKTGSISGKPTTSEAWNGSGVLNQDNGNNTVDKFLQAQFCAAITRHAIDVATANVGYQDFQDSSRFYVTAPYNYYAKFWHMAGISYNNNSYGFPYDDVADQSSTLAASLPTKTTIHFGGFANISSVAVTSVVMSPSTASITTGGSTQLTATIAPTAATIQTVSWSSSNTSVATVSTSGLVTAVGTGTATITATTTSASKTATCVINVTAPTCTASATTGDYTVQVSASTSNPTLTFIPSRTNVGATTCILYYGTSATAVLPGYRVAANTPYTIAAASGSKIYFYYAYSLPEGGENNTATHKHNFTVGTCSSLSTAKNLITTKSFIEDIEATSGKLAIYPNPSSSEINILNADPKSAYTVLTINGKIVLKGIGNNVDISKLAIGIYFLKINEDVLRFIKN